MSFLKLMLDKKRQKKHKLSHTMSFSRLAKSNWLPCFVCCTEPILGLVQFAEMRKDF